MWLHNAFLVLKFIWGGARLMQLLNLHFRIFALPRMDHDLPHLQLALF